MEMENNTPKNGDKALGVLFGVILYGIWALALTYLCALFVPARTMIDSQTVWWFIVGPVIFFVVAGRYLLYDRRAGRRQETEGRLGMMSALSGFIIWLLVVTALEMSGAVVPALANGLGGFCLIFISAFLFPHLMCARGQGIS
ncbi:hypothetical protein [Methanofollis sp. UBA420]|jgi:hypothetical protein|uniref:hypothetical protein n=1 Tax=Methanofollis sp. UBA420 TaxID=1915514 RepID=UPI00316ABEAE